MQSDFNAFAIQLCTKMDMPELAESPDFKTNSDRVKNREKLLAKFHEKFGTRITFCSSSFGRFLEHNLAHWKSKLRSKSFPSAPVNTMREAFEHEQVRHLKLVKTVTHPVYGEVKVVGQPISSIHAQSVEFDRPSGDV